MPALAIINAIINALNPFIGLLALIVSIVGLLIGTGYIKLTYDHPIKVPVPG